MIGSMIAPTGIPWLDEGSHLAERFVELLSAAETRGELNRPVESCPGWSLWDLAVHVGNTHSWCEGIVRGADPRLRPATEPAPGEPVSQWYRNHAESMRATLADVGPEHPCWTLVPHQRTALFWQRRQVHELIVHLWDAQRAVDDADRPGGRASVDGTRAVDVLPDPAVWIDPVLAFDAVAEVAEVMYPRMLHGQRVEPLSRPVVLTATDVHADPVVLGGAAGAEVRAGALSVEGPAVDLMLLVWQRIPWEDRFGDPAAGELLHRALVL